MTSTNDGPLIVPPSILDTDLYKVWLVPTVNLCMELADFAISPQLSMQQAALTHFPNVEASYNFTNRTLEDTFTRKCFELFKKSVQGLFSWVLSESSNAIVVEFAKLSLSPDERYWLERTCPYLKQDYLDYLQSYRFRPDQVTVTFEPLPEDTDRGHIGIVADGLWVETILWEVPLMACLSELYFTVVNTDWDYEGQPGEPPVKKRITNLMYGHAEQAYLKGKILAESDCIISEFGTRRRRSYKTQYLVMGELIRAYKDTPSSRGQLATSNVY